MAWIDGRDLHVLQFAAGDTGGDSAESTVDLGRTARLLVRTAHGYAFIGTDREVYAVRGTEVTRIGGPVDPDAPIVGDREGSWVGWTEESGGAVRFVSADLLTGRTVVHDDHLSGRSDGTTAEDGVVYMAISDGRGYWVDDRGTVETDLDTGEQRVLVSRADSLYVRDVTANTAILLVEGRRGSDLRSQIADADLRPLRSSADGTFYTVLSPDGRWVGSTDGPIVSDTRTGEVVTLRLGVPGLGSAGYDWIDDDTVVVASQRDGGRLDLLTCEVPAGDCDVVAADLPEDVVLAHGLGY